MAKGDRSERRKYRGTPESVVNAKTKLARPVNGTAEPVVAPSQEAIRQAIESGICPWCGRGPFKMLAGHVNGQHGIDRFEFREMAGLTRHTSICDPAFADERREHIRRVGIKPPPARRGRNLTISTAGREQMRANAKATHAKMKGTEAARQGGLAGGRVRGDQLRKERQPCVVCSGDIAFVPGRVQQKTCSKDCLTVFKARTMSRMRGQVTVCHLGHPFSEENTYVKPSGGRVCKTCRRERQRNRSA